MTTFEHGRTYWTRFACDADAKLFGTVVKRTPKMVTFDVTGFGLRRCRVSEFDGRETAFPLGRYSMAPCLSADRRL